MSDFSIQVATDGYSRVENTEDGPVERWVEYFYIVAETPAGERYRWGDQGFADIGAAKSVLRHLDVGTPDTSDRWLEIEPRYGSDAWGDEDEYNLACFEADAYGEPRPRW